MIRSYLISYHFLDRLFESQLPPPTPSRQAPPFISPAARYSPESISSIPTGPNAPWTSASLSTLHSPVGCGKKISDAALRYQIYSQLHSTFRLLARSSDHPEKYEAGVSKFGERVVYDERRVGRSWNLHEGRATWLGERRREPAH